MVKKQEVKIKYEDKEYVFVLKELTWGEYNDILRQSMEVKNVGGLTQAVMDIVKFRELMLLKSIESANIDINEKTIKQLPATVGEMLYKVAEELNPLVSQVSGEA